MLNLLRYPLIYATALLTTACVPARIDGGSPSGSHANGTPTAPTTQTGGQQSNIGTPAPLASSPVKTVGKSWAPVSFKASGGQFVSVERGGGFGVVATSAHVGNWEKFTLEDLGNGNFDNGSKMRLLAPDGHFVCAEGGGGRELVANRITPGPWEEFTLVTISTPRLQDGATFALRATNGLYVVAESGGGRELRADRSKIGPWETFTLISSPAAAAFRVPANVK